MSAYYYQVDFEESLERAEELGLPVEEVPVVYATAPSGWELVTELFAPGGLERLAGWVNQASQQSC